MQGDGQVVPTALNQNLLRQDLKNFLGAGKDQVITQKFLEEYLNRQKQGLFDNILSQYAHDTQKRDQTTFSNAIIQSSTQQNNSEAAALAHAATNLIDNPNQVEKALVMGLGQGQHTSPSKKHRQLI